MTSRMELVRRSHPIEGLTSPPEEPVGVNGISITRGIDIGFVDEFTKATEMYGTLFCSRPRYQINLLKPGDVKEQTPLAATTQSDIRSALKEHVPSLWLPRNVKTDGIGLIPVRD